MVFAKPTMTIAGMMAAIPCMSTNKHKRRRANHYYHDCMYNLCMLTQRTISTIRFILSSRHSRLVNKFISLKVKVQLSFLTKLYLFHCNSGSRLFPSLTNIFHCEIESRQFLSLTNLFPCYSGSRLFPSLTNMFHCETESRQFP